jgi:hypothetical protein
LTLEEVAELETIVEQNPHDLKSRSMLLAYYLNKRSKDEITNDKRIEHALWLLENYPETEGLSAFLPHRNDEIAELWMQQLDKYPDNLQVIYNAGTWFTGGYIDRSIECYQLGKSLDPETSAKWDQQLAGMYRQKMRESPEEEKQVWAEASLRAYEDAYVNSKPPSYTTPPGYPSITFAGGAPNFEKPRILREMTRMALTVGDLDKATDYANLMLESEGPGGGPINFYDANYVLGMVAVQNNDLEKAGEYLLATVDFPGSPQSLYSFKPNMSLAKELVDRGQRDVVLSFLKKCPEFWTGDYIPCSRWIQEIEAGETPDFSGHLNY